jgi:hypothetical protein
MRLRADGDGTVSVSRSDLPQWTKAVAEPRRFHQLPDSTWLSVESPGTRALAEELT